MKKLLTLLSLVILTACTGVPIKPEFPSVSETLMVAPPVLKETPMNASSSEVFEIVIENYGMYHDVVNKLKGWQQWYIDQKKIYDQN